MATTTLAVLEQRLSEQIGDYISELTTTNITTNTSILSTGFKTFSDAEDDAFNDWHVYLNTTANPTVERKVSDYVDTSGTITVFGANLAAESTARAVNLQRFPRTSKVNAIKDALREIYPVLYEYITDTTLVASNILPNSSFEDWAQTTYPDEYTKSATVTLVKTTTAGLIRGDAASCKATAGAATDYFHISSKNYPRLLDLQGHTVSFKAWAYPEEANDASIVIYTVSNDGSTTQTLTSTSTNAAGVWTLLELTEQAINGDLDYLELRFYIKTNAKYVYFDATRLIGLSGYEYLLPTDLALGSIKRVSIQTAGSSDDPCDDIHPRKWESIAGWSIVRDGSSRFIRLPYLFGKPYRIKLEGITPFTDPSADTSTITIEAERVNLIVALAKYKFYSIYAQPASSEDTNRYKSLAYEAFAEYQRLKPSLRMPMQSGLASLPVY